MNCIIVEDEPLAQDVLVRYIELTPELEIVAVFNNAIEALAFLNEQIDEVDLVFLDIKMPELSGFQILKVLDRQPAVVLTTAYSEYALESYDFGVVDYLLKPIDFDRFLIAVGKVRKLIDGSIENQESKVVKKSSTGIFLSQDQVSYNIDFRDILYMKAEGNYIAVHTVERRFITRMTMHEMEQKLDSRLFIRIHKSYIISIPKIIKTFGNRVVINNEELPIGSIYKLQLQKRLEEG